jgi:hypothetical protein
VKMHVREDKGVLTLAPWECENKLDYSYQRNQGKHSLGDSLKHFAF